jgi:hypothetical protein
MILPMGIVSVLMGIASMPIGIESVLMGIASVPMGIGSVIAVFHMLNSCESQKPATIVRGLSVKHYYNFPIFIHIPAHSHKLYHFKRINPVEGFDFQNGHTTGVTTEPLKMLN